MSYLFLWRTNERGTKEPKSEHIRTKKELVKALDKVYSIAEKGLFGNEIIIDQVINIHRQNP